MSAVMELLYHYWIGQPQPSKWPEALAGDPVKAHGFYCFNEGFSLALLLAMEALYPETR